ncbi:tenascin-like isoform X2 [Protopterus annectens]|uniref:tenascin-like isoform X2 n=1 Tax=Protopterus annectens TaxID=7888 RepID=UPI001CFBC91F|nr:tenascin-like isoform X2 [Protopterus annectens]
MGLFWGLVILLFIETIEEAKGGVYIKRFRQRRALLANATSEDPIVFNHVYNIRMPDCESCSADVSAPSIFEASDDPKEHKYEHNIQGRNQVVFTHRINIPPQACGCSNDKDIEVLLSRLEALESQVSTLRDQCSNTGCCDGALAGKRQTDIRILCNGHGTFDSTKCNCDCEKGWTGPTCSDPECPSNCNKHGKCINGRCVCDTGFTGADCSETECPDDCNDQGRCIDGKCVCFVGYSGPRCDIKICPDNCNNRGRCVEGTCICNTGFSGPSCNVSVCPDNCSNKGRCINGKCVCYSGFSGPACNFKTCPNNCNNNGRCINGKCVCHTGFAGPSCSTKVCPNNCNNNGRCVNGKCECNVGFIGPSCGTRTCPDNCNNNGRCVDGKCECNVGFSGPSCGTRTCPDNCNNNGRCVDGKCECNIGFSGPSCGTRTCPDNCNNNGRCVDGRCECNVGFTGPSCASRTCPDNCNNNGHCVDGRCECNVGFTGPSCASRTCPNNCNNNGRCIDGKCECIIGFTGPSCATRNCPHNCNNNGRCVDGKCECNVGYTGPICATRTCPDNCNKNGRCVDGKCECNVGFTGPSCANKTCPGNCNNRGRCENGKCFCETGFSGEDCSTQCPKKCSSKGSCINGVCICFPGYTGSDCSKQSCPRNCNNRGRCINGQCICIKGFVGSDCSMKACPNDCSNRGKCLNGTCLCEEGFSGHDCSKGIPTVENLQVRNIQDTSVMLEWTKPRIAVDGYKISFRPMDNDEGFISIRINETVRRFTQTGLQPGKEYTVTVQAEKNQKYGPASTKSIVTLIDSVQNLRVTGVSNNSISLKWDKSAADVERYIISYVSPTGKKGHLEVSSEADTAVLRNLEPGVRYLITVVAEMGSEQSKPARTNASTEKKKKTKEVGNGKMKASQEGLHTQTLTVPSTTISTKKFPPISDHGISQKLYPVAINKANMISKTTSVPKTSFVDLNTKATSDKSIPGSHRDDNAVPDNSDSQVPRRKVNNKPLVKDTTSNTLTVHSVAEKPTKATLMLNEKSVISPAGIGSLPKMIAKTPMKSKKPKGNLLQPPSAAYPSTKTVLVMTTLTPQEPVSPLISTVLDSDKNELGSMKPGQTTTNVHSKHSSTSLPVEHNSTSAKNNNSSVDPKDVPLKLNLEPPASDQRKNFNKIFQSILNRAPSMNKAQIVRLQIYLLNLTSTLKNNEIKKDAKDLLDYLYDLSSTKVSERVSPDTVASRTLQSTVLPEITIRSVNKMPQGNTFPQLPVEHVPLQPVNILEHATVFKGSLSITSTVAPHQNENSKFTSFYRTHMEGYDPSLTVTKKTKLYTTTQNPSAITKKVDPVVSRATATGVMLFFDNLKKQYDRFYVIIRSLPELTVVSKMNLPGNSSSVNITALNPGTTYKAYLYGIKKDRTTDMFILLVSTALKDDDDGDQMTGQDDHSVVQMTTPASQPKTDDPSGTNEGGGGIPGSIPSVLGTLSATDTSPHSLRLSWTVKSGSFTNYLIRYRDPVTGNSENIHLAGDVHTFLLTGLIPNKQYEIQLHGVANGQLMPPLITKATTVPLKDHSKPTNMGSLTVKGVTNNSFSLTWKALKGAFDSFIVQYEESEGPSPQAQEISIPGNLRTAIIRGLKPDTEYKVHVYGVRGNQRTQPLTAVTITEKALERPVLDSLSVSDVTENSMRLTWTVKKGILDSLIIQYRDSQNETHRETISGDLLTTVISGLKPSQEYVFNVTGISGGRSTGTQLARGKTAPSSPKGLTFTDIQDTSVTVNWLLPAENVDRIKVSYTTVPDGEPQNIIVEGKRNKGVLTGLTPASKYEVSVISMRGFDESEPLSGVVMTLPDSPSNLRAVNVTETTALLHWRPALAPVDNYMVTYNTKNAPEATRTTSGNTVEVQLSDLKHNTEYTVKVYSVKEANRSRPAVTVFTTAADAIKDLWVTEVSPHSAVLSWNAPKVPVSGYVLSYETATGKRKTVNVISSPTSYNLTDLHPGTKYNVHLQAVRGGNRMPSVDASFTTVLDSPSNLRAVNVSDTTALLHWTPALAAVDNYVVTYNAKNAPEVIRSVSGNTAELQLSGLKVSTEYSVKVHSAKGTNESQPAFTVFTTAADAPKDLKASAVSPRGAVISWKPPKAPVSSYMLSYETAAGESKGVNVNASATVYKLTGLYPATKYNIHLHAVRGGSRMAPINTSFTTVRVRYPFPKDCSQEMLNGLTESGLTTVYMNGDRTKPFQVYCDMETDGGGWLVLQRRMNGKTDFWRGWKEYAEGFGDPREEFWLGNEKIHNLTKQNRYKLRIDLRAQAESAYAEYDDFRIDNATKYYKLHLGKYSGNAGKDCTVGYT